MESGKFSDYPVQSSKYVNFIIFMPLKGNPWQRDEWQCVHHTCPYTGFQIFQSPQLKTAGSKLATNG